MSKRILLFDAPKGFLIFPMYMHNSIKNLPLNYNFDILNTINNHTNQHTIRKLKFTTRGSNEIKTYCTELGYEITHFDFDARLIKKFGNITLYLDKLNNYFTSDDKFNLNYIDNIHKLFLAEFDLSIKYDYILCTIPTQTHNLDFLIQFQIKFCLIILKNLKDKLPNSKILVGGNACYYNGLNKNTPKTVENSLFTSFKSYKENEFIDQIILGMIDKNDMKEILESKTKITKIFPSINKSFPIRHALDVSNIEDLRYDYKFIFNHYGFDIPDESFSNHYIQQIESKITFGCNGGCAFCSTKKGVVILSYNEMKDLMMSYIDRGYNSFFFLDDAINPIAEQFCNWIIQKNLKIHWSDDSKHSLSKDYFKMLFESGCRILNFGCESFDNDTLKYINKGFTKNEMLQSLIYSHESNILNTINLIFNLPYSKDTDIYNSEKIILENKDIINEVIFYAFRLLGNSSFYKYPNKYNIAYIKETIYNQKIWKETKRKSYTKILKNFTSNYFPSQLKNNRLLINVPQHLIFALYDIYKTKDKVIKWLNNNYYKKLEGDYKHLIPIM